MFVRRWGTACLHACARASIIRFSLRFLLGVLCLSLLAFMPTVTHAQSCPTSFTVASGGTYQYNTGPCTGGQGTNGPGSILSGPFHGSATISANDLIITYVNNGDSSTSDSFVWEDATGASHSVAITIGTPTVTPITISPTTAPNGTLGQAYTLQFSATGGNGGPYTFVIDSGVLPAGLSDNSSGLISGTPTESGSFTFTESATDSADNSAQQSITLVIGGGTISVTPTSLPNAVAYQAFSQTLSASGGTAPYTYSQVPGTAPPSGITIGSSGTISGTATALGSTNFSVEITDSAGVSTQMSYTLQVVAPTITLSPSSVPNGTQGSTYAGATFSASGGTAPYTFTAVGSLPTGLSLSSAGVLSGTPTSTSGSPYSFTVTATDAHGFTNTTSANYTVTIAPPLSFSPSLSAGTVGVSYSHTIAASGGQTPYTYALNSGALPAGLSLNTSTGAISGTPTAGGTFNPSFKVTDANGATATSSATTLTINAPTITVSPTTLPNATQQTAYSQTITASGGIAPYTYAMTSGSLPAGITLNANTGVLSGTPTVYGNYTFTITAVDSSTGSGPYSGTTSYALQIAANSPVITTTTLPAGTAGSAYPSTSIAVTGGTAPYTYQITSGTLPAGLQLNSNVISGTPTAGGTFPLTLQVTDANGKTGTQTYSLVIAAATVTITPGSVTLTDGTAASQTLTASGGTSPYTFSVTSGSLPPGLSLSSSGVLSGTPTYTGAYNFTVQARDSSTGSGPYIGTQTYSGNVGAPTLNLQPGPNISASYGQAYSLTFTTTGGTAPYSYTETGTLPTGLSFNASTATLSGVPAQSGNFNFSVTSIDHSTGTGAPFSVTQNYTLTVSTAVISLTPTSLLNGTVGSAYTSTTITATGGISPYTYSLASGSLPAGMSLSSSGTLSGTPTAGGAFTIDVVATDQNGATGNRSYNVTINPPTFVITPAGPALSATYGQAYTQTFTATGGTAPYTFSIPGLSIPGLSFNASTATLSGTPTQPGNYNFTVTVIDHSTGTGPYTQAQTYSLTVTTASISITPASLSSGTVGTAYTSTTLAASGGIAPYTYSLTGSLPPGMSLSSSGTLSGTPTASGTFNFSVTATDHNGVTGTQPYTLPIATPTITLLPATLPAATAETAYTQTLSASGGTAPYHYQITSGALPPGLALSSSGTLSGTPTAAGAFTMSISVIDSSTGTGAPFSKTNTYTLNVNAPSVSITPTTLPGAQVAVAYNQQLAASGGDGSYTFSISAGALPAGVTLSTSGLLSGTPTAAGNFNFTVTAKDSLNFTGSQAYTLATQQPRPVANNDTATTPANQAVTINVTSVDTGPITSIAIASSPTHGTATVSGVAIVYTPTHDFFGTDTLTYIATGPGGTSAPATVTITVTPLAVPTVAAQTATVIAGNTVTINAANGATGGPFTATTIVKAPTSGTVNVSGTSINYTAAAGASGQVSFTYTLSNAFGVSLPAAVTVTVDPRPIVASQNVSAIAGRNVQVNLTQGATGGPFTAATLVGVSPSTAGTATIVQASGGYLLSFTSSPTFSGVATVTFTLSNAYATSNPGTVSIAVASRPDPSKDAQVLGVLGAEADATREFAQGQIQNFQQHMESLHGGGGTGGFQNGLTFMSDSDEPIGPSSQWPNNGQQNSPGALNRRYLEQPQTPANPTANSASVLPDGYTAWTGGAVNFGSRDTNASASGFDFTTAGISAGMDKRISSSLAIGAGLGYGHDDTSVGNDGSHVTANSYNIALYGSFSPTQSTFIDGLIGYQWLSFDTRRFVTADGDMVNGHRSGDQVFASLSAGYEYRTDTMLISPYGRIDDANARLNGYTEQGDDIYALSYQNQTVRTTTGSLGVRADYLFKEDYGTVMPQIRLEYEHDFQGSSQATMSYADLLAGPIYSAQVDPLTQNHFMIGIGVNWQFNNHWLLRLEYENVINAGDQNDQSILINVQKKF
jgi:large repetitive protein